MARSLDPKAPPPGGPFGSEAKQATAKLLLNHVYPSVWTTRPKDLRVDIRAAVLAWMTRAALVRATCSLLASAAPTHTARACEFTRSCSAITAAELGGGYFCPPCATTVRWQPQQGVCLEVWFLVALH